MFADLALCARIERAEAELTAEVVGAASDPHAFVRAIGAGVAGFVRVGSPMNKLIGAGLDGPLAPDTLADLEAAYATRGEPVRIELATLADPAVVEALAARGYRLHGFENVLGRAVADAPAPARSEVLVETVEAIDAWGEAAVDGFASPDGTGATVDDFPREALLEVMTDVARAPSLRRYLARVDGLVAGSASARLAGGVVQLCGASTLPAFRRRGVQRALLEARLADARAAGCDLAVVTTAPGSQSQANVMRRGFALLYARAVLLSSSKLPRP